MPDATRAVRTSPELIPEDVPTPGFDIVYEAFDTSPVDLACRDHRPDVSATLATTAFGRSSSRWLGISDLTADPEGPTFISRTFTHLRVDRRCT